jgi:hypothetical protein
MRKDKWDNLLQKKLKGLAMNSAMKRRQFELKQKAEAFQIQEALRKEKDALTKKQGKEYEQLVRILLLHMPSSFSFLGFLCADSSVL